MNVNRKFRPRVAVIGAGFSGIAAAVALKKRGIDDFVIFDRDPPLNLADAEWTDLMDVTAADWTTVATDSVIAYEDPIPQRFYRIEVQD